MIQSIEILKRFRAAEKYGEKGKAGVIEFYLKNANVTDKNDPAGSAYKKVETESVFPGGEQAWRNFITKNLNASVPANKGAPEGTYTVVIKFVLDRNGVISDITPLTSHGYGMEEEAMRVISKGANWQPAMQNGRPVKTYRKQPVTFQVSGQD